TLNRCVTCKKSELEHTNEKHRFLRNPELPEWHGWHAARRGLGSNLYRLGVNELVIQRILRHANVSTTATYYIKTAAEDVRNAMTKLENIIPCTPKAPAVNVIVDASTLRDTVGTPNLESVPVPPTVN